MLTNVILATFSVWSKGYRSSINGMVEPMLSFFLPKVERVALIDGMHPGSYDVVSNIYSYKKGKLEYVKTSITSKFLKPFLRLQNTNATQIIFKIRDFLTVLEYVVRSRTKYDLFIGLESIYATAGIFLKKIGLVRTVVYYVSDYAPKRYSRKWFNFLYIFLDRFCAKNADYIWDVSSEIQKARIFAGFEEKKSKPIIITPNALFPSQIVPLSFEGIIPYSLVFAGTLGLENGPDTAIKATKLLIKKYPKVRLNIFGGNEEGKEDRLKSISKKLNIENYVIFHGFIRDANILSKTINKFMIGLAPYKKTERSVRAFGDATKLRLYMGAGLPVITTTTPPLGRNIAKLGCALTTNDKPNDFAKTIDKIFSDKKLYISMREKAINYAKSNTWNNTYSNALKQMNLTFSP